MVIIFKNIFKVNQRLELMLSKKNNDQQYTSRIEEFIHNHMIIAMPMEKGYPVFHERGKTVFGKVFVESGVYTFKSTFIDKKMNPLPIWIVTLPSEIEKCQQRSFVRFDVSLPILLELPPDDGQDEVVSLKLITKDLSGGGLQVISSQSLEVGKALLLTMELPDCGVFKVDGEVVRVTQPQADRRLFWISIKFVNSPANIRDKISKFIFRKQLEQRQRGL